MKKLVIISTMIFFGGALRASLMDEEVVFVQASPATKPTYQQFRGSMSAAHNAAFGASFLFEEPLDQKHVKNWNQAVKEAKDYVKKTVVTDRDLANKSLLNAATTLAEANDKIVTLIIESYRSFFSPRAKTEALNSLVKDSQQEGKEQVIALLQPLIKKITGIEEMLQKHIRAGYRDQRNQEVAELLHYLAIALVTTAEKVQRDLLKQ